jgi:UDP-glucuronate decarboxylase
LKSIICFLQVVNALDVMKYNTVMKILLTGVAGFLGSHIAAKLLNGGHSVVGIDDFSTGNKSNILTALSNPNFKFVEHDVRLPFNLDVDAILNFACPASPKHYQLDPVRTIETNFLGIINLLRLARDTGALLIQASTSEIYGDPIESPQKESYWGNVNPIGIRSCYDEGKRAAETLCFDYKRQYGVDSRIIRIFNTYGPNMSVDDGRVVSNFIVQAIRDEPITIYGDGKQTRSFCYVSDLVEGIYKLLNLNQAIKTPINLGNPNELTMIELAKKVIGLTNSKSKLIYKELPLDDPKNRKPDISLAQNILGWEPKIEIDEGISLSIDYFREKI